MMTKISTVCDMSYSVWVVGLSLSLGLTLAIVSKRVSKTMMTKISTVCDMSYPIWVVGLSLSLGLTLSIVSKRVSKTMMTKVSTVCNMSYMGSRALHPPQLHAFHNIQGSNQDH